MSGLGVIVTFDGSEVERRDLDAMVGAAAHRAVHSSAIWTGRGAGAAHLRLEVTPQDRLDRQPLVQGALVCVADVRLDNRPQLLRDLQGSDSLGPGDPPDSEILLAAFRRWGAECVDHLLGDFAFVVWDTEARRLFAARDAMGARSLYYRVEPGRRVLLATEVKQLLAAPGVPRRPDESSLLADLAGLYASPHATHYEGIEQLAPAHALLVDEGRSRTWRYWTLEVGRRLDHRNPEAHAEAFREVFTDAVTARLRSDRPVGLFLSGGLDSTAVAATASWALSRGQTNGTLHGFSWAFDELTDMDERSLSAPLAAELGLPVTDVPGDDAWPLKDVSCHGPDEDEPYLWLYQELVDRTLVAARSAGATSMMTTDRGDEMTGGWTYDDLGLLRSGHLRLLDQERRAYLQQTGRTTRAYVRDRLLVPLATSVWPPHSGTALRAHARRLARAPHKPYAPWVPDAAAERFGLRDRISHAVVPPRTRDVGRLHRHVSILDPTSFRVAQLRQRTFARQGLQYADPWGDRRVAEFVCAVPQWVVQRRSEPKRIAREAMRGVLPEEVRARPPQPNAYPLYARAFDEREVHTVRGLLKDSRAEAMGLLRADAVLASYESYLRGEGQKYDFWDPLTVELWLRRWWD